MQGRGQEKSEGIKVRNKVGRDNEEKRKKGRIRRVTGRGEDRGRKSGVKSGVKRKEGRREEEGRAE